MTNVTGYKTYSMKMGYDRKLKERSDKICLMRRVIVVA